MEPLEQWGCPELGSPDWARWFDEHDLGWLGRAAPDGFTMDGSLGEPTLQSALSARHPVRATRKRELQQQLVSRLARALDELFEPAPPASTRIDPVARAVEARAEDARTQIRAWRRSGRTVVTADPATNEVRVSLGVLACDGVRGLLRYDASTGERLGDTCDHGGPCGARVIADEALAAWLDGAAGAELRAATRAPGWQRALSDLAGLASAARPRVRLHRSPGVWAELVDGDPHPRARQLTSSSPVEVLRAASLEVAVECAGERVRVLEADLPVEVTPVDGGARLSLPALGDGEVWFAEAEGSGPPGELRWVAVTDTHRRLARWTDTVFPTTELGGLLARLRALPLAVRVAPGTLGVPCTWDGRLAAELSFDGGGLTGTLRVAVAGGGTLEPGAGEAVVSCQDGAARWELHRDLSGELARVEALRAALGLPADPLHPLTFSRTSLPEVVALVSALDERDDVLVTWRRPLRILTLDAHQVRLTLRPAGPWFSVNGEVDEALVELPRLLDAIRDRQTVLEVRPGEVLKLSELLFRRLARLADAAEATSGDGVRVGIVHRAALGEALGTRLTTEEPDVAGPPSGLRATLRDYQLDGFRFLARRSTWAPGVVLADDMGLGKTLQALALVAHRGGPTLVVAPTSVLPNWMAEARRFVPALPVTLHHGGGRSLTTEGMVVTSWDVLVRDRVALAAVRWRTVVFDEAHAMKNPRTRRAAAASELSADFRVALTGTPVENHLGELWSLFSVVVPGLLPGEEAFRSRFSAPIERGGTDRLDRLRALVHPFLLRRTKASVALELPARTEVVEHIALSRPDRAAYDRLRRAASAHWSDAGATDRFALLAALTRLRQLACDARLVTPSARAGNKLERLVELLREARREGHRALVFSEFTSLLDLAEMALAEDGLTVLRLDGSTSLSERERRVQAFQEGAADVFLLSRKAGGTGLNLTTASVVIHLDPWWNPAAEDQATDRAHRIGQVQPVTVIRLVGADTLEERVLAMQLEKRRLVAGVLDGAGSAALDVEVLRSMLREEHPDPEPRDTLPAP